MLITIRVPDDTAVLRYARADEFGGILTDLPVTAGMVVAVAPEGEQGKLSDLAICAGEQPL